MRAVASLDDNELNIRATHLRGSVSRKDRLSMILTGSEDLQVEVVGNTSVLHHDLGRGGHPARPVTPASARVPCLRRLLPSII